MLSWPCIICLYVSTCLCLLLVREAHCTVMYTFHCMWVCTLSMQYMCAVCFPVCEGEHITRKRCSLYCIVLFIVLWILSHSCLLQCTLTLLLSSLISKCWKSSVVESQEHLPVLSWCLWHSTSNLAKLLGRTLQWGHPGQRAAVNLIFLGQLSKSPDESSRIFLINGQGVKLLQAFGCCKRHVLCCMVCMFVLLRS